MLQKIPTRKKQVGKGPDENKDKEAALIPTWEEGNEQENSEITKGDNDYENE